MKLIKNNLIYLILILAVFLRFFNINNLPSLNPDEAALGYNAYSLLHTGRDEHGIAWPLHFKSFGDYKPGGYVYLALPFIKFFGLTPLAVRLPNLILSVLTIYLLYKLIFLLTESRSLSLLSALVLCLSPWHLHFSRGAWESSMSLFFLLLGIYWFYSYIKKNKLIYLFLFPLSLVATLYIYHSARIVAPVLILILLISNWKLFVNNFKKFILPFTIAVLLTIPVFYSFINNGGTTRFGGVGLTADQGPINRSEELLNQHNNVQIINRIMHNKRFLYLLSWSQKYLSHYNLNFLFINGDEVPRSKVPEMGQLYLIELPFLILGIINIIKSKNKHLKTLTFSWFFVAPLASSLTFQAPSALRSLSLVIPLSIFIASGLKCFLSLIHYSLPLIFIISIVYIYSIFYYLDAYYVHAPMRYPFAWNTGFNQVIPYLESQKNQFNNIYFTTKYDQPYILYLFYSQYDPTKIQSQIKLTPPDQFGFSTVKKIDNIHFGIDDYSQIEANSLIISTDENIPLVPIKTFNFPNGDPGFKIYINE